MYYSNTKDLNIENNYGSGSYGSSSFSGTRVSSTPTNNTSGNNTQGNYSLTGSGTIPNQSGSSRTSIGARVSENATTHLASQTNIGLIVVIGIVTLMALAGLSLLIARIIKRNRQNNNDLDYTDNHTIVG